MVDLRTIIEPAMLLLPAAMRSREATVNLLAINLQEDPQLHRHQRVKRTPQTLPENVLDKDWAKGPARGLWQFEQEGGVRGVLRHYATAPSAAAVCAERGYRATAATVYDALEYDDILACCFARLLLWTDPQPLPKLGDADGAWRLYLRTWRPGKPHPERWAANYAAALAQVPQ